MTRESKSSLSRESPADLYHSKNRSHEHSCDNSLIKKQLNIHPYDSARKGKITFNLGQLQVLGARSVKLMQVNGQKVSDLF